MQDATREEICRALEIKSEDYPVILEILRNDNSCLFRFICRVREIFSAKNIFLAEIWEKIACQVSSLLGMCVTVGEAEYLLSIKSLEELLSDMIMVNARRIDLIKIVGAYKEKYKNVLELAENYIEEGRKRKVISGDEELEFVLAVFHLLQLLEKSTVRNNTDRKSIFFH